MWAYYFVCAPFNAFQLTCILIVAVGANAEKIYKMCILTGHSIE